MKGFFLIIISCIAFSLGSCSSGKTEARVRTSFNDGWRFSLGDYAEASATDFDDGDWRTLALPHDWAIEGAFSKDHPSGTGGGALPGGIGWYRKSFDYRPSQSNEKVFIDFDGVYMNSEVYLNGALLGKRPYGYISFRYDLTPYLKTEGKNLLAVKVDNAEQPNSRWYSGCGIYRNVWLTKVGPVHVDLWGTYVTTPEVSAQQALVQIETSVRNDECDSVNVEVISRLIDAAGKEIGKVFSGKRIAGGETAAVNHKLAVSAPRLWSVSDPYLYQVKTEIIREGEIVDDYLTSTGIRSFRFDAEKGFILNGERMKINGVCMHHDLGCLGAAVNTRAIERQLEILKEMGCNGIRTAHNPPAPELLDLCDRMGFIVMDETFDMWARKKTKHDYARYFNEWHERDLRDLVLRDRNHPSVFMWCIGNEVLEQWSDASADTLSLEEANLLLNFGHGKEQLANEPELSVNSLLCIKLKEMVRDLDQSRPVTAGCNEPDPSNHLFRSGALDIIGFNYHDDWFAGVSENFPGKPFLITESVSALMTRGYYRMPSDEILLWPERWDKPFYESSFSCSSYDNCHVPWGNRHEATLSHVKKNDFISGQYIWTGFDYLGEPTPFGWPARSSYFGIVDLAGFPKDIYYMYQSEWSDKTVLHLFPHWNWTPGQEVDMWAYYNGADEVELFVNGVSKGIRRKDTDSSHVMWRVNYEPGSVKVISRKAGGIIAEKTIRTAGQPDRIRLTADRSQIEGDGTDLSFITVEVLDRDGNLCPNADNQLYFEVSGAGFLAGVDNGNPVSLESFKKPERKAFNGKCLVVLQNKGEKGSIRLKADSEGLETAELLVTVN